ncbi:conserved hypothetical protein [Dehalogenimonas lykanthroporepellens BL-DC-9]|nr:conserved hypothetical protein [Dehalogenimonas lykanthroporepellens BL-DC-9]
MTASSIYIIDTCALIAAYRHDFPPTGAHNGFWEWLNGLATIHQIVIPQAVREEIECGTDGLSKLIVSALPNTVNEPTENSLNQLPSVLGAYGVRTELDIEFLEKRADPYIIALALETGGTVVTNETSNPNRTSPQKKKIPDICHGLNINCLRYTNFVWQMSSTFKLNLL